MQPHGAFVALVRRWAQAELTANVLDNGHVTRRCVYVTV